MVVIARSELLADVALKSMVDPSTNVSDASESFAEHIPVKRLVIGSWSLASKFDEHVFLSFYWPERKLVWEVLHLGVVRKMESDFEDIDICTFSAGGGAEERLVIELQRPPRFFKENAPTAGVAGEVSYVYTTDFTSGQASAESRHTLYFEPGAMSRETIKKMAHYRIRVSVDGERTGRHAGASHHARQQPMCRAIACRPVLLARTCVHA